MRLVKNLTLLRRRRYIIMPKFQFKYLAIVIILVFIIMLTTIYIVNLTLRTTPVLENLSEIEVVTVTSLVYRTVLYICCVFVIIIAVLGIFVLHRIAGPLYVFDKMFNLVSQGDLTIKVKLRKGDELKELAESFQRMIDNLNLFIKTDKEKIDEIKKEVKSLSNETTEQGFQQKIDKINLLLDELYKNFKIQ
jgi:methyl-accepting chemotaxis protein